MEQLIQGRYPTLEGGLLFWAGVIWWLLCTWLLCRCKLPFSLGHARATLALRLLCWSALLGLPLGVLAFLHPQYAYSTVFSIWQSLTAALCVAAVVLTNVEELMGRELNETIPTAKWIAPAPPCFGGSAIIWAQKARAGLAWWRLPSPFFLGLACWRAATPCR